MWVGTQENCVYSVEVSIIMLLLHLLQVRCGIQVGLEGGSMAEGFAAVTAAVMASHHCGCCCAAGSWWYTTCTGIVPCWCGCSGGHVRDPSNASSSHRRQSGTISHACSFPVEPDTVIGYGTFSSSSGRWQWCLWWEAFCISIQMFLLQCNYRVTLTLSSTKMTVVHRSTIQWPHLKHWKTYSFSLKS